MRLEITAAKNYNNEANMRSQRDAILEKLEDLGFEPKWVVRE